MKRLLTTLLSLTAVVLVMAGCGHASQGNDEQSGAIDTISYGFGVNMGMATNRTWAYCDLDMEQVRRGIKEYLEAEDKESVVFLNRIEHLKAFTKYGHVRRYMSIRARHQSYEGDTPDTLPQLPELYDTYNTREDISYNVGVLIGSNIVHFYETPDTRWVLDGFNDGIKIIDPQTKESMIKIPTSEYNEAFLRYTNTKAVKK